MIALLLGVALSPAFCAGPSPRATIVKDREETDAWLKNDPASYLRAVRRVDFGARTELTVGSDKGADVRLEGADVAPWHVRVAVQGEKFHVQEMTPEAFFGVGGGTQPAAETTNVTMGPGTIRVGRYQLKLSHQGFPAIIVFDPKSPRVKEFHPIPYFPIDLSYRFVAPLIPDAKSETVAIKSSHSADRRATRVGWFEFSVGKTPCRLAAYRLREPGVSEETLSVFFQDATTGKETYAVGRYLEPERQPDGRYVLDFNMAYSPACAFSKFYNCPLPPKENRLSIPIRAGQKDPKYH